ncbi:MAG: helix-turn-helix domain-containing protein [Chloroflexota bacterium]
MSRPPSRPLRPLSTDERADLEHVARSTSERADRVAHARVVLVVADGATYQEAARVAGQRSRHAVASLVARFNLVGLPALDRRPGSGRLPHYGAVEQERILREFHRVPDRARDGTATWSLTTLQRALRAAPDGFPGISTVTILRTLWGAGLRLASTPYLVRNRYRPASA